MTDETTITVPDEDDAALAVLTSAAERLAKDRKQWLTDLEEAEATFNGARQMIDAIDRRAGDIAAAIALLTANRAAKP